MNQTPNYALNQWEADDEVLRADFNADNQKIEAAILAARKAPCCVHGTYVGNGGTVTVDLGFRPSFIVVIPGAFSDSLTYNAAFLMGGPERQVRFYRSGGGPSNVATFTDNGFQITETDVKSGLTATNVIFHYYAFY